MRSRRISTVGKVKAGTEYSHEVRIVADFDGCHTEQGINKATSIENERTQEEYEPRCVLGAWRVESM